MYVPPVKTPAAFFLGVKRLQSKSFYTAAKPTAFNPIKCNRDIAKGEIKMSTLSKTALALVIVGALNWLLVGLFNWDLVAAIFGHGSFLSRAVYIVVGLCGLYCTTLLFAPAKSTRAEMSSVRRVA